MARAAVAAGASGLIIEVHNNPSQAQCDGPQSLTPENFKKLSGEVSALRNVIKNFERI